VTPTTVVGVVVLAAKALSLFGFVSKRSRKDGGGFINRIRLSELIEAAMEAGELKTNCGRGEMRGESWLTEVSGGAEGRSKEEQIGERWKYGFINLDGKGRGLFS
jgi:hypothetical protein